MTADRCPICDRPLATEPGTPGVGDGLCYRDWQGGVCLGEPVDWRGRCLDAEDNIARLDSLCRSAAEELTRCWDAHTDDEGFGPCNLIDRLRGEIGGGYTSPAVRDALGKLAEANKALRAERDAARRMAGEQWQRAVLAEEQRDAAWRTILDRQDSDDFDNEEAIGSCDDCGCDVYVETAFRLNGGVLCEQCAWAHGALDEDCDDEEVQP